VLESVVIMLWEAGYEMIIWEKGREGSQLDRDLFCTKYSTFSCSTNISPCNAISTLNFEDKSPYPFERKRPARTLRKP
jgi:hypothetical protein